MSWRADLDMTFWHGLLAESCSGCRTWLWYYRVLVVRVNSGLRGDVLLDVLATGCCRSLPRRDGGCDGGLSIRIHGLLARQGRVGG